MSKDNILQLIQPTNVDDQLTEILRTGARALLAQAVEAEVADFLGKYADLKTADGHQRIVRHGHLPEREVMTGIGPVAARLSQPPPRTVRLPVLLIARRAETPLRTSRANVASGRSAQCVTNPYVADAYQEPLGPRDRHRRVY